MKRRMGFTLPELMVAVVLLCVVGAAISEGLRRQQQVFRGIAIMVAVRGDVRDAAEVLAADLSMASPLDTFPVARDSAVEFFSTVAASLVCDSAPGYVVRIPPEKLVSGTPLTVILATPDSGDILLVYRRGPDDASGTADWERHTIASVASHPAGSACASSTGFTTAADAAAPTYALTLRNPVADGVRRGSPVRILRRTRYSLYRSSDSRWYLGNRRCNSQGLSTCGTIQPLSGPYLGYSAAAGSGVLLTYFDDTHSPLPSAVAPSRAARIGIAIRARGAESIRLGHASRVAYLDSVQLSTALRNRE